MEVIDRGKLFSDLTYRFTYVSNFIGFGEEDIAAIKGAAGLIAPFVPIIVQTIYDKLFSYDVTKAAFLPRNDGFEGSIAAKDVDGLTVGEDQVKFRMGKLEGYFVKLVTAEYDEDFIKYLDHVGRMHTPKSGNDGINVDLIHCNALMGYVEDILIGAVISMQLDNETKKKTLRAFNKLLWIQNDLFAKHYVIDGEDYQK